MAKKSRIVIASDMVEAKNTLTIEVTEAYTLTETAFNNAGLTNLTPLDDITNHLESVSDANLLEDVDDIIENLGILKESAIRYKEDMDRIKDRNNRQIESPLSIINRLIR